MKHDTTTLGPGERVSPFALLPFGGGPEVAWKPGQPTVLSFCALWCETWRAQSARLRSVRHALAGLPITFLTISVDGRWAEKFRDEGQVLLDTGGRLSTQWGVRAVPHTFVLDKSGIVRFVGQGITRTETLLPLLRDLATSNDPANAPENGAIYLAFADFPAPSGDDDFLLDILRRTDTPATFFCREDRLRTRAGQSLALRALREGHSLQIDGVGETGQTTRALQALGAPLPTLLLSPNAEEIRSLSGNPLRFRFSLLRPFDDLRPGTAELSRRVLYASHPGSLLILHAGVRETRDALPDLIASLRRRGLRFGTVSPLARLDRA